MASTTEAERAARRREVAKRIRKGESYAEIADALDVSKSTVARDVRRIRERWRERRDRDFSEHVASYLAELRAVKREAFRAYLESAENDVIVTTEGKGHEATTVGEDGTLDTEAVISEVSEVKKRVEKGTGDSRFLHVYLRAQKEIGRVLGVGAWSPPGGEGERLKPLVETVAKAQEEYDESEFEDEPLT